MTPNELRCLTTAAEQGPLLKTRAGFAPANGDWPEGKPAFGVRTVMGLARLGLLIMPDTTQAWIARAGRAAIERWQTAHPAREAKRAA